jgi:lysyl-tRNA synthetase class 2
MATLKELRNERLRKLQELYKEGINPYPATSNRTHILGDIRDNFKKLEDEKVCVAGRILNIRKFGKIAFIVIKDGSGTIQLFLEKEKIKTENNKSVLAFKDLPLLDSGDFIEATGVVIKTKTEEISVAVEQFRILAKALRPLPVAQDGFTNKEERLRRRYIDININNEVKERFIRRSKFWQNTRDYLIKRGYIEINTPILEHVTGGADANPFVTHMDSLNQDFYLRISQELPLKRLIGAGYEKVFDIGPRFRNENYSDEHLPEHIAIESYTAYQDYRDGIQFYEAMMKDVAQKTWGTLKFKVNGFEVDLDQDWPQLKYADILGEKFGVDVLNPDLNQMKQILKMNNVQLDGEINIQRAMDNIWKLIRRESKGPFWLVLEPAIISPLAKRDPTDDRLSQRFHPIIAGTELGNGYSELNDPIDQLNRFLEQEKLRAGGDLEAQMLDIDFVEMLEYGMPPTCGWGYSERFFWVLEGVTAREGVPFPNLRFEVDSTTKSIYPNLFAKSAK